MIAIETRELTRGFRNGLAVDGVSFTLERGGVLALLGPNGAGKTTTVRLLNGVLQPDAGSARVLDLDPVGEGDALRHRTGVLTENAGLDDRLTTRENLAFAARLRGFSSSEARRRVDELLERFGMASRADDLTQGFSTGQRKRVALARALLHDPELLFLDEPTSGLDPAGARDVVGLIHELAREGRTIVLATHFLGEAGKLATHMAVLHRGVLRAFGVPRELAAVHVPGVRVEIDLGMRADERISARLARVTGVSSVEPIASGARIDAVDREVVPRLVAALVSAEVPVYGASAHEPGLEEVYFAIEHRLLEEDGEDVVTDAFRSSVHAVEREREVWR